MRGHTHIPAQAGVQGRKGCRPGPVASRPRRSNAELGIAR